jgi:tetratricopeptide (TPR) repeat protein
MHAATLLLLLFIAPALCQTPERTLPQVESINEINEGARAYKSGKFREAQQHFERALELDPDSRNAPAFIARAIHSQFKPGRDTPENLAVARAAIAAYHRVLNSDPSNDEAYNSLVYLYGQVGDEATLRQWLMSRAADVLVPADRRARAYTLMASTEWNCSYEITELKEPRATVPARQRATIKYLKPTDEARFYKAKQCAERGMELVEQAINLDAGNLQSWSYKTNLLRELSKLAEMEGDDQLRADYQKRARAAQQRTTTLSEQEKRKGTAQE